MAKNKNLGATAEFKIKRTKTKSTKIWQKILICIAVFALVLAVAAVGVFLYYRYCYKVDVGGGNGEVVNELIPTPAPAPSGSDAPDISENENESGTLKRKNKTYNFLVLGCDRAQWLTDVIMIASYDMENQSLAIMQIPRDTYVTVNSKLLLDDDGNITAENFDGKGGDYGCKINSVVSHGGKLAETELKRIENLAKEAETDAEIKKICKESFLDITKSELEAYSSAAGSMKTSLAYNIKLEFGIKYLTALLARSFGLPVDFYAHVNLDGFVNIVDAIGGVDVYIQENMDYDDPYQDLHIHLKKGNQHLNGSDAEGFIRFRYGYAAADLARIDAQKIFMTAFIKKVFSLEGITKMDKLLEEVNKNLTTNVSLTDAAHLAANALSIDFSSIIMLTMPGTPQYVDGVSYYSVHKENLISTVNTYLNKYTEDLGEEYFCCVSLANKDTSTPPLSAEDITENQPDLGFMY